MVRTERGRAVYNQRMKKMHDTIITRIRFGAYVKIAANREV